jgi:hypothetical protein
MRMVCGCPFIFLKELGRDVIGSGRANVPTLPSFSIQGSIFSLFLAAHMFFSHHL